MKIVQYFQNNKRHEVEHEVKQGHYKKLLWSSTRISLPHVLHDFWRKLFLWLYSINFIAWLPKGRHWAIYMLQLLTRLWRHKFWNYFIFLIKLFFLHDQKVKTKIEMSWKWKELLRWNGKHFSSIFKGFQLIKIVSNVTLPFSYIRY